MTDERRAAKRHVLWIPVQMDAPDDVQLLAVSRNISVSGALVIVGAALEVGARVQLTLQVPTADDRRLEGEVVRVETNEEDPEGLWRYRLAIAFEEDVSDLVSAFERLEKAQP